MVQKAEEGVLIAKELEVLLTVAVVAEAPEERRQGVEAVVRMGSRRRVVVVEEEERAVRRLERVELELVTLMAVEGPCLTAFEMKEAVSVASCQSVEVVLVSHLCSRPASQQV